MAEIQPRQRSATHLHKKRGGKARGKIPDGSCARDKGLIQSKTVGQGGQEEAGYLLGGETQLRRGQVRVGDGPEVRRRLSGGDRRALVGDVFRRKQGRAEEGQKTGYSQKQGRKNGHLLHSSLGWDVDQLPQTQGTFET